MVDRQGLGARLRALRRDTWSGVVVHQRHVAEALNISVAIISAWENDQAVPPEDRLNAYSRFFATERSMVGGRPVLLPSEDLTAEEDVRRAQLGDELSQLREAATLGDRPGARSEGSAVGGFWHFPDGGPITILCTPFSSRQLGYDAEAGEVGDLPPVIQYATNPTHPNYVRNVANGDVDALIELVGSVRAANPESEVRWMTYNRIREFDQLTGHLVVLGGVDGNLAPLPVGTAPNIVGEFLKRLELPVQSFWDSDGESEFDGGFRVRVDADGDPDTDGDRTEIYRPRFLRDETQSERPRLMVRGAPQLEADLALIVRKRSPVDGTSTVSILSGMFSRGTYGAVRAFTHKPFRDRNEEWLDKVRDRSDFWVLCTVPVVLAGTQTTTPDLSRGSSRLATSG